MSRESPGVVGFECEWMEVGTGGRQARLEIPSKTSSCVRNEDPIEKTNSILPPFFYPPHDVFIEAQKS